MEKSAGRPSFYYFRRTVLSLLLLITTLFGLRAQISFAPTNVYNGWSTSTQAFATVPTAPGLTFSQIARGSGLTSPTPVSSGITSTGWANQTSEAAAAAANKFFFFSITANASTSFTVSSILFAMQRSGTGPGDFQVQCSINGGPFAAFGNPFNTTSTNAFVQIVTPVSPISIPSAGNVVFRVVGWNSSNVSGTCRINNNTAISGTYTCAASTISTTGATGAPFCISSAAGAASNVSYTATGSFTGGNIFSAQLSDAAGSFASPVTIGTLASTSLNGTINATIPAGTAPGTGYRVRVVSSSPAVTGSNNGSDITIRAGVNFSYAATTVSCNGAADGAITSTVNEGISPFTYLWSTGATASSITGLSPGTYSLTVTANNGCTSAGTTVAITEPAVLTANASSTDVQCNGANDGSVTLSVSGGTAAYSYAWSNSATTQSLTAVGPGSYSVIVTDNNGCTQTATGVVTEPSALSAAASAMDVDCNGDTDGSVTLSVSGGTGPYTYSWSNSATTQNLSGVTAGTYSVTITDDNNCTQTASAVVTEPAGMSVSSTVSEVSCNGGTNGSVNLSVSGGATPYTFSWSNSATTQNISGVAAGSYSVVVTDNNGCGQTVSVTITEPDAIAATATATDVLCNNETNGSVNLAVNGGTAPYSYVWDNSAITQNISGLAAGTYSVVVTDNNGCTQSASVTVAEPGAIIATTTSTDVLCNSGTSGIVNLTVNGGTAPYSYAWNNSATTQNISNLAAGNFSVTITDNNGCTQTASAVITEPTALNATASAVGVDCNGGTDGSVTLSVSGGTAPYAYAWSNSATTQNLSGVPAGTYSVAITDDNNCVQTASVTVTEPAGMSVSSTTSDVSCNGGTNGSANLSVSGGATPYSFSWSNSATTQNISGVAAGTYSVTVTDNNGCGQTVSVTVTEPGAIGATATVTNVLCNSGTNGSVNLAVNGGIAPYSYAWSNSATTQNISGLAAGTYSVIVTDNNGCTQTASAAVTQPNTIVATATATNVLCNNGTSGTANLAVNGGTGPYSYAWSNSANTQNISALTAGTYSVIVTDNNSCTQTTSVTITEPNAIVVSATSTDVLCNNGTNGSANLSVNGGTAPYTYTWSNSATTQNISTLTAGTYSVIVTDNNSCTQTASVAVTEPNAIAATSTVTAVLCNNGTNGAVNLAVNGGTGPYTYAWSNSAITQNISNLAAGTYSVIITDNNSCTQTASATITEPGAIVATTTSTDVLCNSGTNGTVNLSVNGGTNPYTYAWNNSATTQNISNLVAGTYSVIITDNNSCTQTTSVTISEPGAIVATTTSTDVLCNGGTNGNANLTVNGGTAPYTYAWSNSAITQNVSNLAAGTYSVIITDNNGCTQTASTTVTQPNTIVVTATATDVLCSGGTNGAVNLSVNGGTAPYTYAWNNSATSQNLSNLSTGTYSVIITDNNGCTQTASATVTEPNVIVAVATATDVLCNAGTNGAVNLSVNGGTSPYTYAWNNSATSQNISNLIAGTFSVVVTDNNGCTQTASVIVTEPGPIVAAATSTDVLCNNGTNGTVNLSVNGGTAPYAYAWSNSATSQNLSNLSIGTYSVIITDNNGCTQTAFAVVTEPNAIVATSTATDVLCNGGTNGAVNLAVNGGTAPYTYAWSNSASTQNISNLTAGTYSVIITDNNGCTQTTSVTVIEPFLMISTIDSTDASCGICADGSADLTVTGGTAPYTYAWSNSATSEDLTNVLPGTYTVIVTDNNGCQQTDSIVVNFSTAVTGTEITSGVQVYPNPSGDGNITISLQGDRSGDEIIFVLYDLTGRAVYQETFNGTNMYRVSLPVANGTYLFAITRNGEPLQSEHLIIAR